MGIDHISNSSLLNQLEQMNKQMNAMAQGGRAMAAAMQNQNPAASFGYISNQNTYFDGASAARALRDQATANINGTVNPSVVSNQNTAKVHQPVTSAGQTVGEFKQLLKDAFENVNVIQNESASLQSRFDVGDRSVTLADVMIASNKSNLSFEATLQIRNKLVDAYQSIMQMQI